MTEDWVHNVWLESCKRNVHASDPEFQVFKCPVFHGLTVTCSNLPRQQKEEIRKLINDNGEDCRKQFCMAFECLSPYSSERGVMLCVVMVTVYQTVQCHVSEHRRHSE